VEKNTWSHALIQNRQRSNPYGVVLARDCRLMVPSAHRQFDERLCKRGKATKIMIGAAMRKLVHLAYGVLNMGLPLTNSMPLAPFRNPQGEVPHQGFLIANALERQGSCAALPPEGS
jgi:hypothetical protein